MNNTEYTRKQIEAVYDEIDRRVMLEVNDGTFETVTEVSDYRNAMLQGTYSALMVQAKNWPQVVRWCDEIEAKRYTEERRRAGRI